MPLTKTLRATPEGGTQNHYDHDGTAGETALFTGPLYGTLTVADGTRYRVDEDWITVRTEHLGELMHLIGVRHETEGHPFHGDPVLGAGVDNPDYEPFIHECSEHCGTLRRTGKAQPKARPKTLAERDALREQHRARGGR